MTFKSIFNNTDLFFNCQTHFEQFFFFSTYAKISLCQLVHNDHTIPDIRLKCEDFVSFILPDFQLEFSTHILKNSKTNLFYPSTILLPIKQTHYGFKKIHIATKRIYSSQNLCYYELKKMPNQLYYREEVLK